ncbi:hypothetical protein NM688_g5806 [Phlebia brevispora]|uniref:Uncharacterized protein n=1 Tax=Phlebia brevispora TaxID=194682 RepID=A0ACC1SPN7_9APHY|nr:hypothetical protein NM688_g5806 [Phlebia brevispora]
MGEKCPTEPCAVLSAGGQALSACDSTNDTLEVRTTATQAAMKGLFRAKSVENTERKDAGDAAVLRKYCSALISRARQNNGRKRHDDIWDAVCMLRLAISRNG